MSIDLIFKIAMLIVVVGIAIKTFKAITSFVFKVALIFFVILMIYKMFI